MQAVQQKKQKKAFLGHACGMIVLWQCEKTKVWWVALAKTEQGHLGFLKGGVQYLSGLFCVSSERPVQESDRATTWRRR
jgi:hypothetical protein